MTVHDVVIWSDRWLNCSVRGGAYVRCWVSLSETMLRIVYDRDDDPDSAAILTMSLARLEIQSSPNRFTIAVFDTTDDEDDVIFRCGEALEFQATLDALEHRIVIAREACTRCQQLQSQLERLMASTTQSDELEAQVSSAREAEKVAAERARAATDASEAAERAVKEKQAQTELLEGRVKLAEARALAAEDKERSVRGAADTNRAALRKEADAAKADAAAARDANSSLERKVASIEAEAAVLRQQIDAAAEAHSADAAALDEAKRLADAAQSVSRDLGEQLSDVQRASREAKADADRMRAMVLQLEAEVTAAQAVTSKTSTTASTAEAAAKSSAAKATAEEQRRVAVESMLADAQQRARELESQRSQSAHSLAIAQERADGLSRQLASVVTERDAREQALEAAHAKEAAALAEARNSLAVSVADLQKSLAASVEDRGRLSQLSEQQAKQTAAAESSLAAEETKTRALSDEIKHLRDAAAALAARTFVDVGVDADGQGNACDGSSQTRALADVMSNAPEFAEVCALHNAAGAGEMATALSTALSHVLTPGALAECGPVHDRIFEALAAAAANAARGDLVVAADVAEGQQHQDPVRLSSAAAAAAAVNTNGSATATTAAAAGFGAGKKGRKNSATSDAPPTSQGPKNGNASGCDAAANRRTSASDRAIARASAALAELKAKAEAALEQGDASDSPLSRGVQVAAAAGYLECMRTFDAASNAVAANHEFRERVMTYLKGPANAARATAAQTIGTANRGHRNKAMVALCRQLERDYCELFDHVLRCAGGRVVGDANWRRAVSRAASECTALSHSLLSANAEPAAIDEAQRRAGQHSETVRQLVTGDSSAQHIAATRELVTAHANMQMALFVAVRRRNRTLIHHDAAESIARFGVALKRAGQILDQSKIPGAQPHAKECLVGWPVVKQLTGLPRALVEEDRAFALMWSAVLATSHGTLLLPSVQ